MVPHEVCLEQFYELLVKISRFRPGISPILVKDRRQRPSLHFSEAPDQTASTMFSLIAVDQHRVSSDVEQHFQGLAHHLS